MVDSLSGQIAGHTVLCWQAHLCGSACRLEDARQQRRGQGLQCEFVSTPELGLREWREEEQYDVVTCMFAIHYFFVTEQALKQVWPPAALHAMRDADACADQKPFVCHLTTK